MTEKLIGMLLGVVLTFGILSTIGLVMAHLNEDVEETDYPAMMGHMGMSHRMMTHWMHGSHYDEDDGYNMIEHIKNCPMMEGVEDHEEMSIEDMDQDGDGLCDICGMPIDSCLNVRESDNTMGCHMMLNKYGG